MKDCSSFIPSSVILAKIVITTAVEQTYKLYIITTSGDISSLILT